MRQSEHQCKICNNECKGMFLDLHTGKTLWQTKVDNSHRTYLNIGPVWHCSNFLHLYKLVQPCAMNP